MRIAFISTILNYPWGGADTLWTRAAESASERGDRLFLSVSAAVAGHSRIATLVGRGAELLVREPPPFPLPLLFRVRRKLGLTRSDDDRLIRKLDSFQPDVVVLSQGGTYDLVLHRELTAWLRSHGIKYRLIANWQEEDPQLDEGSLAFIREAFASADRINFVSKRNRAVTCRHLRAELPNASVIQNPLRWRADDITPWPVEAVARMATVSRLDESKGIGLLLEALALAGDSLPSWRLDIFGIGPDETRLRAMIGRLNLGECVRLRGHVSELRAIWAENHLMVSPAIEDGVPMTIPEAMLCRRPVLATRVGGAEDWLTPGSTGFLCPTRDAAALAATLREAFAGRDRWEAMGIAAAESAIRRYRAQDHLLLID